MGESKLPKRALPPLVRPGMAFIRLRASVQESKRIPPHEIDADTREFMADLGAVLDWVSHLERQQLQETPPPKAQ